MKNFRTYQLAVTFYKEARHLPLAAPLRDQLSRASASIALNLAEGYGRHTPKDQRRFFAIALGSAQECKGVFALESEIIPATIAMTFSTTSPLRSGSWSIADPSESRHNRSSAPATDYRDRTPRPNTETEH